MLSIISFSIALFVGRMLFRFFWKLTFYGRKGMTVRMKLKVCKVKINGIDNRWIVRQYNEFILLVIIPVWRI